MQVTADVRMVTVTIDGGGGGHATQYKLLLLKVVIIQAMHPRNHIGPILSLHGIGL